MSFAGDSLVCNLNIIMKAVLRDILQYFLGFFYQNDAKYTGMADDTVKK